MRILLINPNTSAHVTDLVARHVRTQLDGRAELRAVTGRFGARYIASRAAAAIAGHAALDALAEHGADCDAVYLACFGDPGLLALRELSRVPVVGMAEAACREAAALRPDVVLMDLSMPDLSGIEAMKQIHEREPDLPVVILTAHADPGVEKEARQAGASGFLAKGIGLDELVVVLNDATDGRRQPQQVG
jgi:CheY-like chemotaxis protein